MATYVHGHDESVLRSHRWRTAENSAPHLLPLLTGTERLLDVGSGPGTITVDLAGRVDRVVALETGAAAIALTAAAVAAAEVTNVDLEVGDVHDLPFPDDSFDIVHAHQVLQHVEDPVQALREMARVTRPGGVVAARDSDYSAFVWSPADPALDDWRDLYLRVARAGGGEPDAGRRYAEWTAAAGLTDVRLSSTTWCFSTPEDRRWWGDLWADRVLVAPYADLAHAEGVAPGELERLSRGWRAWGRQPHGLFLVPSVELVAHV